MKKRLLVLFALSLFCISSILSADDWKIQKELYNAIKKDDVKAVEALLEKQPTLVNKKIKYHSYPLLEAAKFGSINSLKLLLAKSANIKIKDTEGNSILHKLVEHPYRIKAKERCLIFEYLVKEKGYKGIENTNKKKETPFYYAFSSITGGSPNEKQGKWPIELFSKYDANLNAREASGKTALNLLSKSFILTDTPLYRKRLDEIVKIAELLIEKGGDVNNTDNEKNTPLLSFLVYAKKLPETMKLGFVTLLMKNGAHIKGKNKQGQKAIKFVERKGILYKIMKKKYKKK